MKPASFPGVTVNLAAPPNWDEKLGPCVGLPVMQENNVCISGWKPTFKEKLKILFGSLVFLHVASGRTQPPVAITVGYNNAP